MKYIHDVFEKVTAIENIFLAWHEFRKGKKHRRDMQAFEFKLEENVFQLYQELISGQYQHGSYHGFYICDPKVRHIHKASVRDRLVHHAVHRIVYPFFDRTFIGGSFSCRVDKGTHKGIIMLERIVRGVSKNFTRPCFALKCDIKKFFDSVDHAILLDILSKKIKDVQLMCLLKEIIGSYYIVSERERE